MAEQARILLVWLGIWFGPLLFLAIIFFIILSRPLKRNEQARLFLKLIEQSAKSKRPLEAWITEVSATEDRSMGIGFHLLAAHIEAGDKFDSALKKVDWFLPPPVRGILLAGLEIGNLQAAVKGAESFLSAGISKAQGAFHYAVVLGLLMLPPFALSPLFLKIFIHPKLLAITESDFEIVFPPSLLLVLTLFPWIFALQIAALLAALFFIALYLGIHQRFAILDRMFGPFADRMHLIIPWKRRRAVRSFSSILAVLLDAEVPETKALELAGQYSGNRVLNSAALRMAERVRKGTPLPDALEELTNRTDFKWRMTTAMHTREGFTSALAGWHDSLEAEAYRKEQGAAHLLSSLMVVGLGGVVCVVVCSVFFLLNHILTQALTW